MLRQKFNSAQHNMVQETRRATYLVERNNEPYRIFGYLRSLTRLRSGGIGRRKDSD